MQKLLLILTILIFSSCSTVTVKFYNDSAEDFKQLRVNLSDKQYVFENVKSGEAMEAIKVGETYSYCYAEVVTNKDTLIFQPIDYVGERLQTWGFKNMHLKIGADENGQNRRLDFEP